MRGNAAMSAPAPHASAAPGTPTHTSPRSVSRVAKGPSSPPPALPVRRGSLAWYLLPFLIYAMAARAAQAQTLTLPVIAKACQEVLVGADTIYNAVPCRSLDLLDSAFRAGVECMIARQRKGGWDPVIHETIRFDRRQRWLYAQGRTRPGPIVTRAKSSHTSAHGRGFAVDAIDRSRYWAAPYRVWYWQGQHAEACGLEAGVFWPSFTDPPHVQSRQWKRPASGGDPVPRVVGRAVSVVAAPVDRRRMAP